MTPVAPVHPGQLNALPPVRRTDTPRLRVATYNIHKGVRGMGPGKRLEIHNLGMGEIGRAHV